MRSTGTTAWWRRGKFLTLAYGEVDRSPRYVATSAPEPGLLLIRTTVERTVPRVHHPDSLSSRKGNEWGAAAWARFLLKEPKHVARAS